jgi:hypothetical protein
MTDPRKLHGDGIIGGSPWGVGDALVETTKAVLMEHVNVVMVGPVSNGIPRDPIVGLSLEGRINKSEDRVQVTYLFDEDGAAAIITELTGLLARAGKGKEVERLMNARFARMKQEGNL